MYIPTGQDLTDDENLTVHVQAGIVGQELDGYGSVRNVYT